MANTTTVRSGGPSTLSLLGVAFVVLKLTHVINWSWWWVLLPFYGGFVVFFGGLLLIYLIAFVVVWIQDRHRRKLRRARAKAAGARLPRKPAGRNPGKSR